MLAAIYIFGSVSSEAVLAGQSIATTQTTAQSTTARLEAALILDLEVAIAIYLPPNNLISGRFHL